MRKSVLFSTVFLTVFGLTLGFTIAFNSPAMAIDKCEGECLGEYYCSFMTGPQCTNPNLPYYVYWRPLCGGGPLNCDSSMEFLYCWNGVWCPIPL